MAGEGDAVWWRVAAVGGSIAAGLGAGFSSGYLKETPNGGGVGMPPAIISQIQRNSEDIAAIKSTLEGLRGLAVERLARVDRVDSRVDELRRDLEQIRAQLK